MNCDALRWAVSVGSPVRCSFLTQQFTWIIWCSVELETQEQRYWNLLLTFQKWSQSLDLLQSWQCCPGPSAVQLSGPNDPSYPGCVHRLCCKTMVSWNRDAMAVLWTKAGLHITKRSTHLSTHCYNDGLCSPYSQPPGTMYSGTSQHAHNQGLNARAHLNTNRENL